MEQGPSGQYGSGESLVGGPWEGTSHGDKIWIRISFTVQPGTRSVTNLKWEVGCEGSEKAGTWNPAGVIVPIGPDGPFQYQDQYANYIKGQFGSGSYAQGTMSESPLLLVCEGAARKPPTQWRTAPKKMN